MIDLDSLNRSVLAAVLMDHGVATVPLRAGFAPIKCPYHEDSNASASVSMEKGYFNCHGCGVSGRSFDLVMLKESVDFKTALAIVEDRYTNGVPESRSTMRSKPTRRRTKINL